MNTKTYVAKLEAARAEAIVNTTVKSLRSKFFNKITTAAKACTTYVMKMQLEL